MTFFGFLILTSTNISSASAASLTLSVPSSVFNLDIKPDGIFKPSEPQSISVKTDSPGGYTLSIKSNSDNNLKNGSHVLTSISSNLSTAEYQAEGNDNTWGYQPSKINSATNDKFLPGPTTEEVVIDKTATSNTAANPYNIILGAKVDSSVPKGNYTNTFIFSAAVNAVPISYSITYNLNSGSWSGTSPQTGTTTESTVLLDSNTPTRENYEFKGWCDQETGDDSCSGTTYQASASIPISLFNEGNGHSLTLWAMWEYNSCPNQVYTCSSWSDDWGYNGLQFGYYGDCWMEYDYDPYDENWMGVSPDKASCPSGWRVPTMEDFQNLISDEQAGSGSCLYDRGWTSPKYISYPKAYCNWEEGTGYCPLYVDSSNASVSFDYGWDDYYGYGDYNYNGQLRCVTDNQWY